MGNDLDVCSKDEHLVQFYEEQHGPKNESVFQLVYRTYNKFCDTLLRPPPINYTRQDLIPICNLSEEESLSWTVHEFDMLSLENRIHCCYWKYNHDPLPEQNRLCIFYLPTNQRALNEAVEVFPLAKRLQCDVFAFDYAGCGKSEGLMHENIDLDIENALDYLQLTMGNNFQMDLILWARGMSTALVINLLARLTKQQLQYQKWKLASVNNNNNQSTDTPPVAASTSQKKKRWTFSFKSSSSSTSSTATANAMSDPPKFLSPPTLSGLQITNSLTLPSSTSDPSPSLEETEKLIQQKLQLLRCIKCLILDSPFISVEEMVKSGIEKMHAKGYYVTKSIIYFILKKIMKNISTRLNGFNVFSVKPVEDITTVNYFPCYIFSADNDDYIPVAHGEKICRLWQKHKPNNSGDDNNTSNVSHMYGNVFFTTFNGRHFPRRSREVIEATYDFVQIHVQHFTNCHFDSIESILALEQQLKQDPDSTSSSRKEEGQRVETLSLRELEIEVMKEIQASLHSTGKSASHHSDHLMGATEHKVSTSEEEAEDLEEREVRESLVLEEAITQMLEVDDLTEQEQWLGVKSTDEVEVNDHSANNSNNTSQKVAPPKRNFSAGHLPAAEFDSSSLLWISKEGSNLLPSKSEE